MSDAPKTIWASAGSLPKAYLSPCKDLPLLKEYTRKDSIPSQDELICAALEAAATMYEDFMLKEFGDFAPTTFADDFRALADDPDALAAIKAKAEVRE
jgi:hypothetical protein